MPETSSNAACDWLRLRRDRDTGIESVRAHFCGHAYDRMIAKNRWSASLCKACSISLQSRRASEYPGAGDANRARRCPRRASVGNVRGTYATLYLPQPWLAAIAARLGLPADAAVGAAFRHTMAADDVLRDTIHRAFLASHAGEVRLVRDQALDALLLRLSAHARAQGAVEAAATVGHRLPVDGATYRQPRNQQGLSVDNTASQ